MIVTSLLLLGSLVGVVVALSVPGGSDLILVAGPSAVASTILLLRESRQWIARTGTAAPRMVVIDGSNVMYWQDGTPKIETVQDVVRHLKNLGFKTGVMFDANAGYLLNGAYLNEKALGRLLGLPVNQVMVVPKGTPADPYILGAARKLGAIVISNDRFRDWAGDYPEVATPGHLIKGEYRQGRLWFDFVAAPVESHAA